MLLTIKIVDNSRVTTTQKMIKTGRSVIEQTQYIASMKPDLFVNPGLLDMKQVHSFSTWRNLVPVLKQFRGVTYSKYSKDVIK